MSELVLNKCKFKKCYTGVGSSKIGGSTSEGNSYLATCLTLLGYKVVSGHAPGSDLSFEIGGYIGLRIIREKENLRSVFGDTLIEGVICSYIPWAGFNGHKEQKYLHVIDMAADSETYKIAKRSYSTYRRYSLDSCKESVKRLMHRNVFQVLGDGKNSEKASFVMACTQDGANSIHSIVESTGGTSMAIAVADLSGVAVLNTQLAEDARRIEKTIREVEALYSTQVGSNLADDFRSCYEAILDAVPQIELNFASFSKQGIDVVIHELNEQLTIMDEVGRMLTREFPSLLEAINAIPGNERILGKYIRTVIKMHHGPVTVVSAITHLVDNGSVWPAAISYKALREVLKGVRKKDRQRKVAICDPGRESGRACRMTTKTIIDAELRGLEYFRIKKHGQ